MGNKFLDKFTEWQEKKYSRTQKILFIVILVPFFFFIFIPGLSFLLAEKMDTKFATPEILKHPFNIYLGTPLFVFGLFLFTWTVMIFFQIGEGTPAPFMPTQKLVTGGPFAYSRNPMVSGVVLFISGLGVLLNSFSFIAVGLVIPLLYLIDIKFIEEKELEARFGQEYLEYKKRVPFLIPHLPHTIRAK